MAKPWEAKPWFRYRPLFVNRQRIDLGVAFWQQYRQELANAERRYQVPAAILVAILAIETFLGRQMGQHPALDSLYTLAFYAPERRAYFAKEFAQLVRLGQQEGWSLPSLKGSYAGALGMAQFMPSSYQAYAVDFDGDGRRDLFNSAADAIASVANYFAKHHWHWQQPVIALAKVSPQQAQSLLTDTPDFTQNWAQLAKGGVQLTYPPTPETPVKLLAFSQANGPQYWVARHNFYVITRYNRSPHYAMAVFQLSQAIQEAYEATLHLTAP